MATEVQYGVACPPATRVVAGLSCRGHPSTIQVPTNGVRRPSVVQLQPAASWRITVRRAVASWRIPSGLSVRRRPPDRFFPWTTPNHIQQIQPAARTTDGRAGRARSSRDLQERELPGQVGQPDRTCRLAETRF